MSAEPRLLYLEPDDEITSLVRRLGEQEAGRVIVVVPGRSRATSSLVALRLLARAGRNLGHELAIVADPATRALAGEADVPAFATLADAIAGTAASTEGESRAPIRVVRGAGPVSATAAAPRPGAPLPPRVPATPPRPLADEVTVAIQLPDERGGIPAGGRGTRPAGARRGPQARLLVVLLGVAIVGTAALLPGATVRIARTSEPVGPVHRTVSVPAAGHLSGQLTSTRAGSATGQRLDQVSATGTVTFFNWNLVTVAVPQGTQVSVKGGVVFVTDKRIVVGKGHFNGTTIDPGRGNVAVTAVAGGPTGNVPAEAIDTVDDTTVRNFLRGSPDNPNRLVSNAQPTSGGSETSHLVIQQSDVDALVTVIDGDLADQLATQLGSVQDAVYAAAEPGQEPVISIPPDLVGTEDQATFSLTASLAYDRQYALLADVVASARQALLNSPPVLPRGTSIDESSIQVQVATATAVGSQLTVQVSISAVASKAVDPARVRDLVAGLGVADAQRALSDYGEVQIDLWPPWVDHLPQLGFRISVEPMEQEAGTP